MTIIMRVHSLGILKGKTKGIPEKIKYNRHKSYGQGESMLELIDVRTLALSSVLILVILAIVMVMYQTQRKVYHGSKSWVWA